MKVFLAIVVLALGGCARVAEPQGLFSAQELREYRAMSSEIAHDIGLAESIELIALSPYAPAPDGPIVIGHLEKEFPIIGSSTTSAKEEIASLAKSLAIGIRGTKGTVLMCFNPRHALRFSVDGGIVLLIVCFECHQGIIIKDGRKAEFLTTAAPESTWDAIFAKHILSTAK